jgi:hypothetical protein
MIMSLETHRHRHRQRHRPAICFYNRRERRSARSREPQAKSTDLIIAVTARDSASDAIAQLAPIAFATNARRVPIQVIAISDGAVQRFLYRWQYVRTSSSSL